MTTSATKRAARWLAAAGLLVGAAAANAEERELSVTLLPVRYIAVDGDAAKFRAHHWMNDGYTGGLKEFSSRFTLADGTVIESDGHALIQANDYAFDFGAAKESLGFITFDYQEFRKYFDTSGGVHRRFRTLQFAETDKDLSLDIGNFGLTTGLTLEGWPALTLGYEREFRDGAKSRLTWASAIEAGETRKIAPSWQDIHEVADVFELGLSHELAGTHLHADQRWEFVRSENVRTERQLATTGAAADTKIRFQDQAPEATLMTTTLGASRAALGDKIYLSSGYHYAHLDSREFETLLETSAAGVITNFSNPEQKPNNRADNDLDSHSWVGAAVYAPWPAFSMTTKLKSEYVKREGRSAYNMDGNPSGAQVGEPDGILNRTDTSLTDNKAVRWGESLGLRYTGLPRTALYTELELEQGRVLMREDRLSVDGPDTGNGTSSGEVFNRETVTSIRRGVITVGSHVSPCPYLDVTAHVRHRRNNNDYDDQRESSPSGSTARSAFIDAQNVHTDEFAGKLTLRPVRWLRTGLRYQFRDDDFDTRVESQQAVKTGMRSHIYTYDVTVQPWRELSTTVAYSTQFANVTTPAANPSAGTPIPAFNANVGSWLVSADYAPSRWPVTLTGALQYARADNFNDVADIGLPLGSDFAKIDAMSRVAWAVREGTSLGVEYDFYAYNGNNNLEHDDYRAHAVWFDVTQTF